MGTPVVEGLCSACPTLRLAQCLGQEELFVEEARPPISKLSARNYAPGPGTQPIGWGLLGRLTVPLCKKSQGGVFWFRSTTEAAMAILRCPPQVGSRQPHVPMCIESGRLGPTAMPVWPSGGRLCLSSRVCLCLRVGACAVCVCFCSHGHIRAPLRKCVPARVRVPSSSPQLGRAEAGVPVCCPLRVHRVSRCIFYVPLPLPSLKCPGIQGPPSPSPHNRQLSQVP